MSQQRVIVIGAGIGGLAAALDLAVAGFQVTLLERQAAPGGKMRVVQAGSAAIDAGPTVFTMRWVFEKLFADAGTSLADHLTLNPASILARHAWSASERLDLFADIDRTTDAIGQFAGAAEARGFQTFSTRARIIYETLKTPFLESYLPTPLSLVRQAGAKNMLRISPFDTLSHALAKHFRDPRLQQLFGRYATYAGSSPFLAPATLMLIAHVERDGVWRVQGGMHQVAIALANLASAKGVSIRYNADITEIAMASQRATGVVLNTAERIDADAVIVNADAAALPAGLFGAPLRNAIPDIRPHTRSLSAITWALHAHTQGFPLTHHNVFFSKNYPAEFDDMLRQNRPPRAPTIYICAQDRTDADKPHEGPERLLCLINAPPSGDTNSTSDSEITQCTQTAFQMLAEYGLHIHRTPEASVITTPRDFNALFPATGGALYGQAVHGPMASFRRPGSRTKIPNLYLAGGSTHPGAGVPMAALSGRLAAASLIADGISTNR